MTKPANKSVNQLNTNSIINEIEKLNGSINVLVFINLFIFTPIIIYFLIRSFS